MSDQTQYWRDYFELRFATDGLDTVRRLDYSNEAVRQQTYACLLEGSGPMLGKTVLDAGCGNGEFARLCDCLGGKATGIDINRVAIEQLRNKHPQIEWHAAPLGEEDYLMAHRGCFHCVVCAEVLQYVDMVAVVPWLWQLVAPGGRMVLMVPNQHCPIIQRVMQRFPGRYMAWTIEKWQHELQQLAGATAVWRRELTFASDQRLQPYIASQWQVVGSKIISENPAPNRLQWVLQKAL
jgi:2-polyprenyl-3-methyl-5-hydroxy-6-metoxy-1,4-benzoquinol methylase